MESRPFQALVVEDSPDQIHLIRTALKSSISPSFETTCVDSLDGALKHIRENQVDVILLDLNVRDSRGLDTVAHIHNEMPRIPIVVFTGSYDESLAVETLQKGAQDYLLKGMVDHHTIIRSMRYAIERKRAEEEITHAHSQNEQLLSAITSILIRVDSNGKITHWNRIAEETFGVERECVVGRPFQECGIQWTSADIFAAISNSLKNKETLNIDDVGFKYPDGRDGMLGVSIIPMIEEENQAPGFLFFGADVTEKKQAEIEKARLEDHVRQVQKLESLGTLAGGIAHDFKNILGPILGYTEMLLRSFTPGSKEHDRLSKIQKATYRAKNLVDQILTFSRKGEDDRSNVNLVDTVHEAFALLKEVLPSTIEIVLDLDRNTGAISANPTQIHQVIMNLCINAGYAMKEAGGKLAISVQKFNADKTFARLYAGLLPGVFVKLSISDTGSGIDPEVLPRIFDPFFTTKPVGEGSGMGLAVVHGIVTAHGGVIDVSSKKGQGTTFDVYFPKSAQMAEVIRNDESKVQSGSGRILVVDDDANHLDMLGDVLESLGYQVEKKSSSVEALELFKSNPHQFDLLVLDQVMPKMTGTKLAREILLTQPTVPIIICTGSYALTYREAKDIGVKKCLEKPVSIGELSQAVREVLAKK